MIATSYYSNKNIPENAVKIRVSIGGPRFKVPYTTKANDQLFPVRAWFDLEPHEYKRNYIAKLEKIGAANILKTINEIAEGGDAVLLCFEKLYDGTWCHRRIFAEWFKKQTGIDIPEIEPSR